jgi:hypothetical protein
MSVWMQTHRAPKKSTRDLGGKSLHRKTRSKQKQWPLRIVRATQGCGELRVVMCSAMRSSSKALCRVPAPTLALHAEKRATAISLAVATTQVCSQVQDDLQDHQVEPRALSVVV